MQKIVDAIRSVRDAVTDLDNAKDDKGKAKCMVAIAKQAKVLAVEFTAGKVNYGVMKASIDPATEELVIPPVKGQKTVDILVFDNAEPIAPKAKKAKKTKVEEPVEA